MNYYDESLDDRVKASPATRRLAKSLGIDLSEIIGTGREGRVEADDLEKYLQDEKTRINETVEKPAEPKEEKPDELKALEETVRMIGSEIDSLDESRVEVVNDTEENEEAVQADQDIIKFMIKNQNDLFSDDDIPSGVIVNYDMAHNSITSTEDVTDYEKEAVINPTSRDRIYDANLVTKVSRDIPETKEEAATEDDAKPSFDISDVSDTAGDEQKIVLTFNDATSNTIILNADTDDVLSVGEQDSSHLVIETKRYNVLNMGIRAKLDYVKEMLAPFVEPTADKIFDTIVKAIVFSIEKNNIENYNDEIIISRYEEGGLVKKKIKGIGDLTVTQMHRNMKDVTEDDNIIYTITDITPLGIDYFFPRTGTDTVDFFVLISEDRVRVFLSVCDVILDDMTIARVLTTVRSVINNPSLMLV